MQKTRTKPQLPLAARVQSARPRSSYMNAQKREKLKDMLVQKLASKYSYMANEKIIEKEVKSFLARDKLNANDMKDLEDRVKIMLEQNRDRNDLNLEVKGLKSHTKTIENDNNIKTKKLTRPKTSTVRKNGANNNLNFAHEENIMGTNTANIAKNKLPSITINNTITNKNDKDPLNDSNMSGASDLSNFDENQRRLNKNDIKMFEEQQKKKKIEKEPMLDLNKYHDEWDAINMYNKEQYEKELIEERKKDIEVKNRIRDDLDYQVKQKLKKQYADNLKEKEYDVILKKHVKEVEKLEELKKKEIKEKMLKEKESRDIQIKDKNIKKRIEELRNKKYERELIKTINEAMEKEKQQELDKKKKENEALRQVLKDNANKKEIVKKQKKEQRDYDIKMMLDSDKMKERQDQERIRYFKNIERAANTFNERAQDILKEQQEYEKKEAEMRKKYEDLVNQKEEQKELDEKIKIKNMQKMLKDYYDYQVEEKKKNKETEKFMDKAQKYVWEKDAECYFDREKKINTVIRNMNKRNVKYLDDQIKNRKKVGEGMSENEKKMNKDLLRKIADANNS